MAEFRAGRTHLLVSTVVIEVGIDVPNSTIMVVEHAERFGLSQLHQLRGRIGRGAKPAFFLLFAEPKSDDSKKRLQVICSTSDGFKVAEEDLKLRGPGEFFGVRQSGLPDLKVAKLGDVAILEQARAEAQKLFAQDPALEQPEDRLLQQQVARFWQTKTEAS